MRFRFIHAADVHLDSPLRGVERYEGAPVEAIRNATRQAFDNLIALAIEEAVDFLLLAGDLYDGEWKDYNTGLHFAACMGRLREAGIRVFLISGNHDAASQITRHLRLPDNVTRFSAQRPESVTLEDLGVKIHGQGFATREVTEDLSRNFPPGDPRYFNIGLLHTSLDGKPGHAPYAPCHVDGLRSKGYQYWALGHVHRREIVSESPWIVFPGNLQGRHIRETGAKGCTLVTVEEGAVSRVEHRNVDVLRWSLCRVDLTGCDTEHRVFDQVASRLRMLLGENEGLPLVVRLVLEGESLLHAELHARPEHWQQQFRALALEMATRDAGIWLEKLLLQTRPPLTERELGAREEALGDLLTAIGEMKLDEKRRDRIAAALAPLRKQLPPELLLDEEPFDPAGDEQLDAALEDVKALLAARLLSTRQ